MPRTLSIVVKTLLVLLRLPLVAYAGFMGFIAAACSGVHFFPMLGATLALVLAGLCLPLWLLCRTRRIGGHFRLAAA